MFNMEKNNHSENILIQREVPLVPSAIRLTLTQNIQL
jgi:hypothetical protein